GPAAVRGAVPRLLRGPAGPSADLCRSRRRSAGRDVARRPARRDGRDLQRRHDSGRATTWVRGRGDRRGDVGRQGRRRELGDPRDLQDGPVGLRGARLPPRGGRRDLCRQLLGRGRGGARMILRAASGAGTLGRYRSTASLAGLLIANAIPLIGVLFFGWSLITVLVLYWLENGIVGLWNIPRIWLAGGDDDVPNVATAARTQRAFIIP